MPDGYSVIRDTREIGSNSFQFPVNSYQLIAGSWTLGAGNWKLEAGSYLTTLIADRTVCAIPFDVPDISMM